MSIIDNNMKVFREEGAGHRVVLEGLIRLGCRGRVVLLKRPSIKDFGRQLPLAQDQSELWRKVALGLLSPSCQIVPHRERESGLLVVLQ